LRIFEADGSEYGKDITFSYEANFFLFATLEVARPMAHARGQPQPPAQQVPVLTGMPVSGMAYLDRPSEAGYFIFPDLSVRHEGKYRLSFNLYEETKSWEDGDKESAIDSKKAVAGASPDASFDWRMEVKSDPFLVYSAKKFPGLAESTPLSRTVAEQGCRVRIRRDVRMRRRETKGNGEYDEAPEDDAFRGRPAEPEQYRERTRSHSGGSDDARAPYPDPHALQHPNPSYTPSPVAGHPAAPGSNGYLGCLGGTSAAQFAPPPPYAAPAPPAYPTPTSAFYPSQAQPSAAPSYRGPPQPPPPSNAYAHEYPQSAGPSYPPREPHPFEQDRRASTTGYPQPSPQHGPSAYPTPESTWNRPAPFTPGYAPPPMSDTNTRLPPLKITSMEAKYESLASPQAPLTSIRSLAPPMTSPVHERAPEYPPFFSSYTAAQPPLEPTRNGGKRPLDHAFSSSSNPQRLQNGRRPSSTHENEDDDMEIVVPLEYKRADGNIIKRNLPETM
jgi:hypothetical protein